MNSELFAIAYLNVKKMYESFMGQTRSLELQKTKFDNKSKPKSMYICVKYCIVCYYIVCILTIFMIFSKSFASPNHDLIVVVCSCEN